VLVVRTVTPESQSIIAGNTAEPGD